MLEQALNISTPSVALNTNQAPQKSSQNTKKDVPDFQTILANSLNSDNKQAPNPNALPKSKTKAESKNNPLQSQKTLNPKNITDLGQTLSSNSTNHTAKTLEDKALSSALNSAPKQNLAPNSTHQKNTLSNAASIALQNQPQQSQRSADLDLNSGAGDIGTGDMDLSKSLQKQDSQKRDLNEMAKVQPKPSSLAIAQGKTTQPQALNSKESNVDDKSHAKDSQSLQPNALDSANAIASPLNPLNVASAKDSHQASQAFAESSEPHTLGSTANLANNLANHSTPSQAKTTASLKTPLDTSNPQSYTLNDVAKKANDLNLNPSNIKFDKEAGDDEFKNSIQNRANHLARTPQGEQSDVKHFFDKQDEQTLRPLFYMLEGMNAKLAANRRKTNNQNKIEYAIEGKSERIAIIHRGRELPKNIVDSQLKNNKQDRVFEQIQKDLLAGKSLDLEQIQKDLESAQNLDSASQPTLKIASQQAKPLGATLASESLTQALYATKAMPQQQDKDPNKRQKDKKSQKIPLKATQQNSQTPKESSIDSASPASQTPQAPKEQAAQSSQSELAQNLENEFILEKAKMPKEIEAKAESKSQEKPQATASHTTNATMAKNDSRASLNPKETIHSFVSQFEQEVKKFKPPMSRISLELSPKEIGDIELTITQQGKNIHINVISNPQALNLFANNQVDLRQGLINAGFEGVNLSFSSNAGGNGGNSGGKGRGQHQESSQNPLNEYEEAHNAPTYSAMEITIPQYA